MEEYRVKPGPKLNLEKYDPGGTGDYKKTDQEKRKAKAMTAELTAKLDPLQERLYANADRSLLIVLQGMDTSGKDGTIKHVMSGANPQGCRAGHVQDSLERRTRPRLSLAGPSRSAAQGTYRHLQPLAL